VWPGQRRGRRLGLTRPECEPVTGGKGCSALRRPARQASLAVLCGLGVGKSACSMPDPRPEPAGLRRVSGKAARGRTPPAMRAFPAWAPGPLAEHPGFKRRGPSRYPTRLGPVPRMLAPAAGEGWLPLQANCLHKAIGCGSGTDWDRFAIYRQCLQELGESRAPQRAAGGGPTARAQNRRRREVIRGRLSQQRGKPQEKGARPTATRPPASFIPQPRQAEAAG